MTSTPAVVHQTASQAVITVEVDTHSDTHHAAVIDAVGRPLADAATRPPRPATSSYWSRPKATARLPASAWRAPAPTARDWPGTGAPPASWVIEVDRPDRKTRRQRGKSDPIDGYAPAAAVLSGAPIGTPKTRDGRVEAIRTLRVARRSAMKARPRRCTGRSPAPRHRRRQPRMAALRSSLRSTLRHRSTISQQHRTTRHRLNRGGDRHVNYALHIIALVRLSSINRPATTPLDGSQGMSNLEIIRCLKRYIAREIHHVLTVDEA
jgi:hypothetical protein